MTQLGMSRRPGSRVCLALALCISACGGSAKQLDSATDAETATGSSGASDGGQSIDPDGVCARYIECVAAVAPQTVAAAIEGFGAEGTCWTPDTAEVCTRACETARRELAELFPEQTACWSCQTDSDCGEDGVICSDGFCTPPQELGGTYLLAITLALAPELPLQYIAEVSTNTNDVTFTLQPLSLDQGSTTSPRQEVGTPLVLSTTLSGETFEVPLEKNLVVAAETNPITGSELILNLGMAGEFRGSDGWCGTASGEVLTPIQAQLAGSSFSAVRLSSRDERPVTFPLSCADF